MIRTILLLGRSKLPEVDILSASALTYGVSMILTILMLGRDQSCLMWIYYLLVLRPYHIYWKASSMIKVQECSNVVVPNIRLMLLTHVIYASVFVLIPGKWRVHIKGTGQLPALLSQSLGATTIAMSKEILEQRDDLPNGSWETVVPLSGFLV